MKKINFTQQEVKPIQCFCDYSPCMEKPVVRSAAISFDWYVSHLDLCLEHWNDLQMLQIEQDGEI